MVVVEPGRGAAQRGGGDGLFLDTSKNSSRRWCDMNTCGVEAKISRQTARRPRDQQAGALARHA